MKSQEHTIILINAIPSFIIAFAVSMFLTSGTITEKDTDHAFVFPQAFIILLHGCLGYFSVS
ncbi:hypothetical protein [Shouchella lehensis]|uniref:Uncharacterized protein n=1 Tax=Shouchella lehensis G1 TaxID=1246626 RepID=A0A060LWS2_9BACI|nr:hypothetical protein [Shouchella lehensis]AIC92743.1 hypothetical protein BleG1_0128 [Shouchella lehensis G1]